MDPKEIFCGYQNFCSYNIVCRKKFYHFSLLTSTRSISFRSALYIPLNFLIFEAFHNFELEISHKLHSDSKLKK